MIPAPLEKISRTPMSKSSDEDRLRGFGMMTGQILGFSTVLRHRSENTLQL